jgi:hypothetical protein
MRLTATPEQIQQLHDGQEVEVLVRMEPQPDCPCQGSACTVHHTENCRRPCDAYAIYANMFNRDNCPVAVEDKVEMVCEGLNDSLLCGLFDVCHGYGGTGCRGLERAMTVRHIAYREQDGVHYWVVRCSNG